MLQDAPGGSASSTPQRKRIQYDRDFILGLRNLPICLQKPSCLVPISGVVLDKAMHQHSSTNARESFTAPQDLGDCKQTCSPKQDSLKIYPQLSEQEPMWTHSWRKARNRKYLEITPNEDIHLNKAENAWKPRIKEKSQEEDSEAIHTQALFRKFRSILNKVTPQMFDPLMKQVLELNVDTEERLRGVIELIFEKAIKEHSFSLTYANMCKYMATIKVPKADAPENTVNFCNLLLKLCQQEFQRQKEADDLLEKAQKELDLATTPEDKARLLEQLDESKFKARRRSIGNTKLIGELFKLKMISENVIFYCIVTLLKHCDGESLECLCCLLTTTGKNLDVNKLRMDTYFNIIEKIVKERKTSTRVRFMLQDVMDLRQRDWVPRRAPQGPKTIQQVHKDAMMEELEEQQKIYNKMMPKDSWRQGGPRMEKDTSKENTPEMAKPELKYTILKRENQPPNQEQSDTKPVDACKLATEPDVKLLPGEGGNVPQPVEETIGSTPNYPLESCEYGSSGGVKSTDSEEQHPQVQSVPIPCELNISEPSSRSNDMGQKANAKPELPSTSATSPGDKSRKDFPESQEDQKQETLHREQRWSPSSSGRTKFQVYVPPALRKQVSGSKVTSPAAEEPKRMSVDYKDDLHADKQEHSRATEEDLRCGARPRTFYKFKDKKAKAKLYFSPTTSPRDKRIEDFPESQDQKQETLHREQHWSPSAREKTRFQVYVPPALRKQVSESKVTSPSAEEPKRKSVDDKDDLLYGHKQEHFMTSEEELRVRARWRTFYKS